MHEAFDIHIFRDAGANIAYGLQIHLAGEHHSFGTKLIECAGRAIIGDAGLRAHMQFKFGSDLACGHHHAEIAYDQRVHTGVLQLAEIVADRLDLAVARQHIAGHIYAGPMLVRIARALFEILKAQVLRGAAHAERLAAAVDGIGTIVDGGLEPTQVARRGQYFRLVSSLHVYSSYST